MVWRFFFIPSLMGGGGGVTEKGLENEKKHKLCLKAVKTKS